MTLSIAQNRGFQVNTPEGGQNGEDEIGTYYALLIATQEYSDPSINPLAEPVNDATKLKKVLQDNYGFAEDHITFLKNPKRRDIYSTLEAYVDKISEKDNLLIFYAGHGYFDEKRGQGYWLPSDAQQKVRDMWISNGDIRDYLKGIKAKHTMLISDACFSGGIFRTRDAFSNANVAMQELIKTPSRRAMTSGTLKVVPDKSVFVEFLIKKLSENKDAFLNAQKLFASIQEPVVNNSPNRQMPQYGVIQEVGDEGGDFVFARIGASSAQYSDLIINTGMVQDVDVFLNGKSIGKASPTLRIPKVKFGSAEIEVRKTGYKSAKSTIQIASAEEKNIDLTMEQIRLSGLNIGSSVQVDGKVTLNGKPIGELTESKTILTLNDVPWGEYTVEVNAEGYKPFREKIVLSEFKRYDVLAKLKPATALLALNGKIKSKIFLNDQFFGDAPAKNVEIPIGHHTLLVTRAGYETFEQSFSAQPDQSLKLDYQLVPKTASSAMVKSMMFPGGGQFYQERDGMGYFIRVSFLAAAGGALFTVNNVNGKTDKFNTATLLYKKETIPLLIPAKKAALVKAYDDLQSAKDQRMLALSALAGIYLYNILDVYLFEPDWNSTPDNLSLHVVPQQSGGQVMASISW